MGSSSGRTEYVTQQTSNAPPGYVQDAQKLALSAATDRFNDPNAPSYFPGQTYVDFSPETEQGLNAMRDRALAGSPLQQAGSNALMNTVSGNMLSASNPYFQGALNAAFDPVRDAVNSSAAAMGRMGSGAHTGVMTKELGNIAANMSQNNYNMERANQLQASSIAPQYAMSDYQDLNQLMRVGAAREGKAGEALTSDINRFNFDQNLQDDKIARLMALSSGGQFGNTATQVQPVFSNPTGNMLGAASSLAGIGSLAFGPGFLGGF